MQWKAHSLKSVWHLVKAEGVWEGCHSGACRCCMQELCSHPFWNTALPERDLPAEPMLQVGACLRIGLWQASR